MKTYNIFKNSFFAVALFIIVAPMMTSCSDDDDKNLQGDTFFYIEGQDELTLNFDESAVTTSKLVVRSNATWELRCGDDENLDGWVRPFPDNGKDDGQFYFIIANNASFDARTVNYRIYLDGEPSDLTFVINQDGKLPVLMVLSGYSYNVTNKTSRQEMLVTAEVPYEVTIEQEGDWLSLVESSAGDTDTYIFEAQTNTGDERTAIVHFTSPDYPLINKDATVVQADGSVIFIEDFNWIGALIYTYNNGSYASVRWDASKNGVCLDTSEKNVWTVTSTSDGSKTQKRTGGANNCVQLANGTQYATDIISPQLEIGGTHDIIVTFKYGYFMNEKGSVKDTNSRLWIEVLDGGEIDADYKRPNGYVPSSGVWPEGDDADYINSQLSTATVIIRNATSNTRLRWYNGAYFEPVDGSLVKLADLNEELLCGGDTKYSRVLLDDIVVKYYNP